MNLPDDFEVSPSGTHKVLDETTLSMIRYRSALQLILEMDSCLLADAQEIARSALDDGPATDA